MVASSARELTGRARRLLPAVLAAALASACSGSSSPPPSTTTPSSAPAVSGTSPATIPRRARLADWPMFGVSAARANDQPAGTGLPRGDVPRLHLHVIALPGTVDSSPIFLHRVDVDGGLRDALFMTTTYGRTIAITPGGVRLWTFTPSAYASVAGSYRITTATPAADPDRRYVYASSPDGLIHKLSIATGREVTGGGWPVRVTLLPQREKIASALGVWHDRLYVTVGGYIGDTPPYQGHVVVIRLRDGRISGIFNTLCSQRHTLIDPPSCPESDSAIWGRAGAVVDPASGDVLVATGNAAFDGRSYWGDSALELDPGVRSVRRSFTPTDQAHLNANDLDLGSSSPVLLSSHGPIVAQGGKAGVIQLVDMGRQGTGGLGGELQTVPAPGGAPLFTAMAVWHRAGGSTWMFAADGSGTAAWRLTGAGSSSRLRIAWSNAAAGTSPVLAGGLLYVYDPGGGLNVYAPATGRRVVRLPAGPGHWSSPIVAGGVVALPVGDANDHATTGQLDLYRP